MSIRPSGRLSQLPPGSLERPLAELGLRARSANCLAGVANVQALLELQEDELMRLRSFGRGCLAEVRRSTALFALARLGVPEDDPAYTECVADRPEIVALWEAPPKTRSLGDVLEETLELLHRIAELYPAKNSGKRQRAPEPTDRPNLRHARLEDVSDFVFANLRPREREVLAARFSASAVEPGVDRSLAEVGRELGLTRERVRQIQASALRRLSDPEERRRRRSVVELLDRMFETRGGVATLRVVRHGLRQRFGGTDCDAAALTHALLHTAGNYHPVRDEIWCASPLEPEEVAGGLDGLHLALRRHGRPMSPRQLAAAVGPVPQARALSEAVVKHWTSADGRFLEVPPSRVGLREWSEGIPESLEEYLGAVLRAEAAPLAALTLTERVNRLMPPGSSTNYREVLVTLTTAHQFERVRPGTYALRPRAELQPDTRGGVDGPAPNGKEPQRG